MTDQNILLQENDIKARLREHDSSRSSCLDSDMLCNDAAARIEQLERELAEARKDAERYQWLRDMDMLSDPGIDLADAFAKLDGTELDAAIDAAIAAAHQEGGAA